jgi:hypothetical protein
VDKVLEDLRRYFLDVPQSLDTTVTSANIEPVFLGALTANGIEVIDTTPIPLTQLVDLAIKHIRPFEQRDKGFKDTLVLYSILDHARRSGGTTVLLLANDEVFRHTDVHKLAEERGIHLDVISSIDQGISFLEEALDIAVKAFYEMRASRLRDFLLGQRDTVLPRIRSETEIDPWSFGLGKLTEVKKVELVDVLSPLAGFLPNGVRKGRVRVYFLAKLRAIVVGEQSIFPPTPPRVKLEEGAVPGEAPLYLAPVASFSYAGHAELVERDINPVVGVEASANFDEDTGVYSDVQIERVFPPGAITQLLQKTS